MTTQTKFEVRTTKTTVAIFDSQDLAMKWLQTWHLKDPKYANSLKLFKVTTHTQAEAIR